MPKSSIPASAGINWLNQQQPVPRSTNTNSSALVTHEAVAGSGYLQSVAQTLATDSGAALHLAYLKITIDGVPLPTLDGSVEFLNPGTTAGTDGISPSLPLEFKNMRFETSLLIEHRVSNSGSRVTTASAYSLDE